MKNELQRLGIPTIYDGIKFRSRMEANVAFFLNKLGFEWEYEKISFLLPRGDHYWPDFYVPKLRLWIECRGYKGLNKEFQIKDFAKMMHGKYVRDSNGNLDRNYKFNDDFLVIRPTICEFHEDVNRFGQGYAENAKIARCHLCESWYFYGGTGSYTCRSCDEYPGGTPLLRGELSYSSKLGLCVNGNSIKKWLEWVKFRE